MPDDESKNRVREAAQTPNPPARESLRHYNFGPVKVKKDWTARIAGAAFFTLLSGIGSMYPYVYSWEQRQITSEQLGRVLYDRTDPQTRRPAPVTLFDERTLPSVGVFERLAKLEDKAAELEAVQEELGALRGLVIDHYRITVRLLAADAEPDPRKRMAASQRAEDRFDQRLREGFSVPEAFRRALERNPYR